MNKIKDESNDRMYFTITPRLVRALCRNPYDLSLWEAVRDIAGEDGQCYISTDDLAILSMMSTGQVSESRRYLLDIALLAGELIRDEGYPQPVWHLSIPDLWARNIEWCRRHMKISERVEFKREQKKSLHSVKASPHEGMPSPHETKKRDSRKSSIKEEDTNTKFLEMVAERYLILEELYHENVTTKIVPIMKQILLNVCKKYDSAWYGPAFEIYIKNTMKDHGPGSFDYFIRILEHWEEKGFGTPLFESKQGENNHGNTSTNSGRTTQRKPSGTGRTPAGGQAADQPGLSPGSQSIADQINANRKAKREMRSMQ